MNTELIDQITKFCNGASIVIVILIFIALVCFSIVTIGKIINEVSDLEEAESQRKKDLFRRIGSIGIVWAICVGGGAVILFVLRPWILSLLLH